MNNIRIRAAAIILNRKKELLLVNHQKNGRSYWLLPGGGVEYGETIENALKRELNEELSMEMKEISNFVLCHETIYPDKSRHIFNVYFKVRIKNNLKFFVKPDKVLKNAEYFGVDGFKRLLFYPDIKDIIINLWKKNFCCQAGFIKVKWKE
ncbi:MAG: NUDIX hydrolase [Candidatus Goldbacteria bacterium]|nr:NUDIX hydrolase [Candidatus Goldiibacteriota bacterium]HPD18653.1 NUDIX hydrolase [Candidatus Goldiibacteriota bacterium]